MGDLNTVFGTNEINSRSYSQQEQRHSNRVKQIIESLSLSDAWQNDRTTHTWRQPGTRKSSRLDRIYYQHQLTKSKCSVDWTFTNSDHGAVIATFTDGNNRCTTKPLRLNPELIRNPFLKAKFLEEYKQQVRQIPEDWDPHKKLEFHKCAMRSSFVQVNTDNKRRANLDYQQVKDDLHSHIAALEESTNNVAKANRLRNKINQLKATITKLNLEKGQLLADKLKTKWYNEGERSNKYFLGILRRRELNGTLTELEIGDRTERDPAEIEKHVVSFYKELYNQPQPIATQETVTDMLRLIEPLNDDEKQKIASPLTTEMLWATLKSTQDSCPGPDGIPYSYLRAVWEWFGPVLLEAWEHSTRTKRLPESHRTSWLRLIPKAGKNCKDLKNWRPITLSNCDHKIITKTISRQISNNVDRVITGHQTAYLKGRSISDNLRVLTLANKLSNKDPRTKGMLIALDAKKAFDSVNHLFIKQVLTKIGLTDFIPTFELLYNENKVDIMLNDKICQGYSIGNGVKQGDALSCVLFILAMEPLIRNIEANPLISKLTFPKHNLAIPKCLGYADDISVITTDSINCLRATIKEYKKLTETSGLFLNADKTEIFKFSNAYEPQNYAFTYRGSQAVVTNAENIKINGILLATNSDETHKINFKAVRDKMDNQFAAWANRGLSLLGKILIYKTFGLSQIIYTTRVINFSSKEHGTLRNLIYKFLWNRNYQTEKAPDRIKRKYLNAPICEGGFGMIDHEKVTTAMNARQVLVNLNGQHPIRYLLECLLINRKSSYHCRMTESLDDAGTNYASVLNSINIKLLSRERDYLEQDRLAKDMFLKEKLVNVTRPERRNCLELTILRNQGKNTVRQLLNDPPMSNHFRLRILHYQFATMMDACLASGPQDPVDDHYIPIKGRYKLAAKVTSNELRSELSEQEPIAFKLTNDNELAASLVRKIKKLKSMKSKSFALRLLHGDIYTGAKLLKFGLTETDECSKCRQTEDLNHVLKDCWYSGAVWTKVHKLYKKSDTRRQTYDRDTLEFVTGAKLSQPKTKLHIELIRRLTSKERPNILPRMLIFHTLEYLAICDKDHGKYYKKLKHVIATNNLD